MFAIGLYQKSFHRTKIFVLMLFNMVAKLEQRSVINFLVVEKFKLCEIYRRMCVVYGEAYFCRYSLTETRGFFSVCLLIWSDWSQKVTKSLISNNSASLFIYIQKAWEGPRGVIVEALDWGNVVSSLIPLGKVWTPLMDGLNSVTVVLLEEWLWH